ncbi:MAG: hypothetical protein ABI775_05485 [Pseudonocardiales bacterium]
MSNAAPKSSVRPGTIDVFVDYFAVNAPAGIPVPPLNRIVAAP